ncbi:caspase-3-like [Alligator sinensis]|uniref:Caspase-3-like n=1 Tax=Alligator sinensis TaxID=38654 RepID=A0A1U7S4W1_ALLSI|nr:caspase-3-like [Alligator sinensis]
MSMRKSRAVVIVNYEFSSSGSEEPLAPRRGAQREADKLSQVLSSLSYTVHLYKNQTAKKIEEIYQQESQEEHGDYFVSILSSHGEEGVIYGSEGKPVKLTRIFQTLSPQRSSALAGKSKIFFIQACRGGALDSGVWLETDSAQPEEDSFSHYLALPDNTAVMFACSPGYSAFLNPAGSMFLQALLELLEGEERHLELARLLTRINWKVAFYCEARGTYKGSKEMPCFVTNMVHEVFPFSQHAAEAAGSL